MDISKEEKEYNIYKNWISIMDELDPLEALSYLSCLMDDGKVVMAKASMMKKTSLEQSINKHKYDRAIYSYYSILNNFTKLVKELNFDDSLGIATLFTYMLWNGYFSNGKNYTFNRGRFIDIKGFLPLNIMNGVGAGVINSIMLSDSLNYCNINSSPIICGAPYKFETSFLSKIDKDIEKNEYSRTKALLTHAIIYPFFRKTNSSLTLIDDGDKYYGFSPTNFQVINILNNLEGVSVSNKDVFILNPNWSLLSNPYFDKKKVYDKLFDKKRDNSFSYDEMRDKINNYLSIILDNIKLLEDFYENNRVNYAFINQEIRINNEKRIEF